MELSAEYINVNKDEALVGGLPSVVKVTFGHLKERGTQLTRGAPTRCKNPTCGGVVTTLSPALTQFAGGATRTWTCEFCGLENKLSPNDEPSSSAATFFLNPLSNTPFMSIDMKYFVFCVDISGSMGITSQVGQQQHKFPRQQLEIFYL